MQLLPFSRRRCLALVAILWLPMLARPADAPVSAPMSPALAPARVIDDIAHWQHPVKDVFARYKLPLQRVTLNGRHATFRVAFPFDPQSQPNQATMTALYLDLLRANGGWEYTLESPADAVAIDVAWKRRPDTITLDIHRL